jgi:hypothetical protein
MYPQKLNSSIAPVRTHNERCLTHLNIVLPIENKPDGLKRPSDEVLTCGEDAHE